MCVGVGGWMVVVRGAGRTHTTHHTCIHMRAPQAEAVAEATDLLSRGILYAYAPLHLGVIATTCHLLCTAPTHWLAFVGATLSTGIAGGWVGVRGGAAWAQLAQPPRCPSGPVCKRPPRALPPTRPPRPPPAARAASHLNHHHPAHPTTRGRACHAGGILFTVAHELLHGTSRLERLLANALLVRRGAGGACVVGGVLCQCIWSVSHLAHHPSLTRNLLSFHCCCCCCSNLLTQAVVFYQH